PPTANNRGSASLQYGFEMPPARNGMAPSLGIQYSSEGGSGWLGEGWNLSVPSITLDTRWGVPRYDTEKETETYLISGSMLSTMGEDGKMGVAHRGEKMPRKADRQFYTRQGGDFSRIIRKGSSPADYSWEVTDKQGVKYTYGGEGAVLKGTITDLGGNTREVISEWKLKRVEETHGDYIEYVYETADEPVRGGLMAKAIYLKEIHAGNSGQQPHTVVAFEGSKEKHLKTNNARYGYLTSSNRLLEKVKVNFQGSELRSYAFAYREGAFHKDVLTGVRQLDDKGAEVSFQNFDYYDDVQSDKNYVPFKDKQERWNTHNDHLRADFLNPLQFVSKAFSDKPSALGGTTSFSLSGSFYAGVGPMDGDKWKGNTIGASYGYSLDKSNGVSTLVDINGDGLPDKVFRKGGALYYRPQIPTSPKGEVLYGDDARIVGVSSFSKITSSTHNGGAKATVGYQLFTAEVGVDFSSTKTKTTEYLSDINGDGLVDLVSGGKVYFNHIEFDKSGNAIPTFTLSSADTPSPIIYSGKIDASVIQIDPAEQAELIKSSPMEDMVRVWQAPKNGTVSISGTVSLITPMGDYDADEYAHADGVRVAIQKGSAELWNKKIAKGDATAYNATAQDIAVKKGDRIYFRVQSGTEETSNGAFDNVKWAPVITYAGTEEKLPDGLSTTVYKSEEGAIYDAHTVANIAESISLGLSGKFTKPVTTDDVTLKVYASNNETDSLGNKNPKYRKKEIYTRTFAWNEAFDGELQQTIPNPDSYTNLKFEVSSTSNVDWSKVRWTPQVEVTAKDGSKQQTAGAAHYVLFADMVNEGKPVVLGSNTASLSVTPSITVVPPTASGTVTMTVKTADKLLGKKTYTLNGGSLSGDPLTITGVSAGKIWIDYSYSGNISGQAVTSMATVSGTGTAQAGFYAQSDNTGMGMLYRGWGGFAYNASEGRYGKPIDESLLKLPDSKDAKLDPRTMAFTPIGTDQMTFARWIGQNEFIYLTADTMGTARLGEQQVILTNPLEGSTETAALTGDCLQGTGATAVTLVSTSKSTVKQGGSMGITYNEAGGTSTTDVTMTDMNGDGYPDIIAGGTIQYTNTQGGLSGEKYSGMGKTTGKHSSKAWGAGGKPVASGVALLDMMTPYKGGSTGTQMNTGLKKALNNLRTSFLAKISISGNIPENTEDAVETFMDINGDGLPDKILTDRRVRLNLGYSFADPIAWDIDRIQGGKTNSYNMSIGAGDTIFTKKHITEDKKSIVKASGSVSGGVGLVTSRGVEEYDLIDINSDGLPDKVWMTDDKVFVALNKGDGFTDGILWKGTSLLSENISTAESVNGAFTYTIFTPMPTPVVKICLNPGTSTGHSINRTTYSLQDVDGDGYLDIVESDKESELKVTRSAIGRTNMLRSVTNSLGGTFTLDYEHTTPTYGLPGGKWVMSSVTVDDGIHDDGPLMKTVFAYSDGQKDRHEREFLGFGKVVTKNIDTEQGESAVYRQAVQLYDVSTYYAQGNELSASVEDAKGNKYTETRNEYDGYYITANGDSYTFNKQKKLCSDRASAFVPLRYTANKQYEGQATGITTSEAWNEYYLTGYHG
ncbi:toxin TcdB middle/N-terminal domain-containing protein, partial [Prevotella corporis]